MDYVLFETAPGFLLFEIDGVEDIASFVESMQQSIDDFPSFASSVKMSAFLPFKSAEQMLENINAVSEGVLTDDLRGFISTYVPQNKILGVSEDKLASAIAEACDVRITKGRQVIELQRAIRLHLSHFVKELTPDLIDKAQRSLGHSYSGAKVKFNVNKNDNMIIQAICLLDQLDKDVNTLAMRAREWYSWHFPELITIVPDNYTYARCVLAIGHKESLAADEEAAKENLRTVLGEAAEDTIVSIIEASKTSMGYEISDFDLDCIFHFAERVVGLSDYRRDLHDYLAEKMNIIAPNLTALMGETIGARLISHAGSLTSLAKYPASTVQILGAEKALFRALKSRGKNKTPKYGLIYHSSFIGRAGPKNKGRISRYLANKASIASRIDCFTDYTGTGSKFGEMLKQQVEERLEFYESGKVPRKNSDCMHDVVAEIEAEKKELEEKQQKKRERHAAKKAAKEAAAKEAAQSEEKEEMNDDPAQEEPKKEKKEKKDKKKKKEKKEEMED